MMIGKLLGHTQVQTTARYAHLATELVKRATNDVSTTIERRWREKSRPDPSQGGLGAPQARENADMVGVGGPRYACVRLPGSSPRR